MSSSAVAPPPNAVRFKRLNTTEIEDFARKQINQNVEKAQWAQFGNATNATGCMGCLGIVLLVVLWPVGLLLLILTGFIYFAQVFGGVGGYFAKRSSPENQAKLAGLKHQYRNAIQGSCPVCKKEFLFPPSSGGGMIYCIHCNSLLRYADEWVWPN